MSKLDVLFESYAAHPLVKAGLAQIDKATAANPLVARDGKSTVFDPIQYRVFVEAQAKKEAANKTALQMAQFQGKPTFQQELALLNGKATGMQLLNSLQGRQPVYGTGATFGAQAASTSIAEYWSTTEKELKAMPAEQQRLVREFYELQAAKDKSGDGFLTAVKFGILSVAGLAFGPLISNALKGVVSPAALTAGGNVAKGVQLAGYAGEGVQIANTIAPIGTGIKIAAPAFDAALATTSGSLFSGLSKVLDVAKTGSNVVKAGQAVAELVNKPAATSSGGSQGVINLNLTGNGVTTPLGATTSQEVAENLPVSISTGTNWLPILALVAVGYFVLKGQS
jgi:hypothetical protein